MSMTLLLKEGWGGAFQRMSVFMSAWVWDIEEAIEDIYLMSFQINSLPRRFVL